MPFFDSKFNCKQQDISEDGTFEGYASVFDMVDHQSEKVVPGAFQQTLEAWKKTGQGPKMLWQHDPKMPIGRWLSLKEDHYGLFVKGQLLLDLNKGREAYTLLKSGIVDGLSIGYVVKKSHKDRNVHVLDQVDLFEVSLVTFMANPLARVQSCKKVPSFPFTSANLSLFWPDAYDETGQLMDRLRALKKSMKITNDHLKRIILESFS
jgi:HK97 family phage prohead protease